MLLTCPLCFASERLFSIRDYAIWCNLLSSVTNSVLVGPFMDPITTGYAGPQTEPFPNPKSSSQREESTAPQGARPAARPRVIS